MNEQKYIWTYIFSVHFNLAESNKYSFAAGSYFHIMDPR